MQANLVVNVECTVDSVVSTQKMSAKQSNEDGNRLFQARQFTEAIAKYQEALGIIDSGPIGDDEKILKAVICGNLCSCYWKLKEYANSLKYVEKASTVLGGVGADAKSHVHFININKTIIKKSKIVSQKLKQSVSFSERVLYCAYGLITKVSYGPREGSMVMPSPVFSTLAAFIRRQPTHIKTDCHGFAVLCPLMAMGAQFPEELCTHNDRIKYIKTISSDGRCLEVRPSPFNSLEMCAALSKTTYDLWFKHKTQFSAKLTANFIEKILKEEKGVLARLYLKVSSLIEHRPFTGLFNNITAFSGEWIQCGMTSTGKFFAVAHTNEGVKIFVKDSLQLAIAELKKSLIARLLNRLQEPYYFSSSMGRNNLSAENLINIEFFKTCVIKTNVVIRDMYEKFIKHEDVKASLGKDCTIDGLHIKVVAAEKFVRRLLMDIGKGKNVSMPLTALTFFLPKNYSCA